MIPLPPAFRRAYQRVLLGVFLYALALLALTSPWLQRQALYLHKVHSPSWWADVNKPEQFGFAKNQVTPFNFTTPDHETIYAWHVMPLGLYARHEFDILQQPAGCAEDIRETKAFRLLRDDPESRLIISFHGNAGTVAQGWRSDSYRSLSDGSIANTHILAIDYRGFGLSTGFPTEDGVTIDGITAVNWALNVAQVPPNRIVIIGHSLGTAVTAAVVEHFAERGIEFAGIILLAGFTGLQSLLSDFCLVGWLSPLRSYPRLLRYFTSTVRDKWPSAVRIENFVRMSKRVRLFILHSMDDFEIRPHHADSFFVTAVNATVDGGMEPALLEQIKRRNTMDMGDGAFVRTWKGDADKIIREELVPYGYHSRVLTYAPVSLAALKAFDLGDGSSILI